MNGTIEIQLQKIDAWADQRPWLLLVEDDRSIGESLQWRLERQGFRVVWVTTGREALAAASHRPAAVLLDLGLPDIDGLAVCQELYERPETCCVPVIILTANDSPNIVRRTRAAGCRFFIRKPCDPSALLVLIHHVLEDRDGWDIATA